MKYNGTECLNSHLLCLAVEHPKLPKGGYATFEHNTRSKWVRVDLVLFNIFNHGLSEACFAANVSNIVILAKLIMGHISAV